MVRVLKPNGSIFINIKPHTNNGERSLYVFDLILYLKRELGLMLVDEYCWTKLGVPGKFNGRFKNAFEPLDAKDNVKLLSPYDSGPLGKYK